MKTVAEENNTYNIIWCLISLSISSTFSPVKVSSQVHTQVVVYIKHKYFLQRKKNVHHSKALPMGV